LRMHRITLFKLQWLRGAPVPRIILGAT
jgi:hypothetical protein